jgi:hypothetical protein
MRLTLIFAMVILAGCAAKPTVTEHQCRAGDWQTIGYRDGSQGFQSTRLLAHQEACGTLEIVPDRREYLAGYREGLANYCTADNGFYIGRSGRGHNNVCSGELYEPFASAYADGRTIHQARNNVRQLNQQLINLDNRYKAIDQEIADATLAQLSSELTIEERMHLLNDLKSLHEEKSDLEQARPGIEIDLSAAERDLASLEQSMAGVY